MTYGEMFVDPGSVMVRAAVLSDDGLYRYRLSRVWDWERGRMLFVMLNPSTADAEVDDPTIRRCMGFARREGCGGIEVLNLYALRATRPKHLLDHPDPEGPDNIASWADVWTEGIIAHSVAAWGAHASDSRLPTSRALQAFLGDGFGGWECLGTTAAGAPRHPLYLPGDAPLQPFRPTRLT